MYRVYALFAALALVLTAPQLTAQQPTQQSLQQPAQQPHQQSPQRNAGQSPPPVRAPFQLTPAHQAFVDQVLTMWEQKSSQINTFKCSFDHWKYEVAFGKEIPTRKNKGLLVYERPDKGTFKIEEVGVWNGKGGAEAAWPVKEDAYGEHFVCDGKKVYVYNYRAKQLEISPVPPELQGKQIVDGPLPFLFGAEAEELKVRYWIQTTHSDAEEIWLDARPKFAADAANYRQVEVILDRQELLPKAIKVYRPNKDEDVYIFGEAKVNDPLAKLFGVFSAPKKPWGWEIVEHPQPQAQPHAQQPPRDARRQLRTPARY